MRNLITLLIIVLASTLACKTTDRIDSINAGCLTPDGRKIGLGVTGKILVLEAESGKIIKELEVIRKEGAIVCSPQNDVLVVYSDEVVNIETSQKYPRRKAGSMIIGINSEKNLVGHQAIRISKQRGQELELFVENPFDQSDDLKTFKLPLEKLDAVQRNRKSFLTSPVKLLDNNELLVFAGGKARELPTDEEAEIGPDVWGFYKVNLEGGEISRTKVIDISNESADLFNSPFTDATVDGKFVAAAFSNTEGKIGFVYNLETGEEIFRNEFLKNAQSRRGSADQIKKFKSIALSKDGSKLAVAGEWDVSEGRLYKSETAVSIYDLKNGKKVSEFKFEERIIDIISFADNELIIDFDNNSIAKVDSTDGKNIWVKQLGKR
jgi:hypothetical protein